MSEEIKLVFKITRVWLNSVSYEVTPYSALPQLQQHIACTFTCSLLLITLIHCNEGLAYVILKLYVPDKVGLQDDFLLWTTPTLRPCAS